MTDGAIQAMAGRRILLVEDEYFIVDDMLRVFEESGAEVIGPAGSVADALGILAATPRIDGAVLDLNLRGEMSFPVADALEARGVPFVFATGYEQSVIPATYGHVPRCEKPVSPERIATTLFPKQAT